MSRKFHVTIEIEMPDDQTEADAAKWGASLLGTAFTKPNPVPRGQVPFGTRWEAEVNMPPSEHPYRPRLVGAEEVAQPKPRRLV